VKNLFWTQIASQIFYSIQVSSQSEVRLWMALNQGSHNHAEVFIFRFEKNYKKCICHAKIAK
jgi:hypothetical protein